MFGLLDYTLTELLDKLRFDLYLSVFYLDCNNHEQHQLAPSALAEVQNFADILPDGFHSLLSELVGELVFMHQFQDLLHLH
jgi:hypothetical protein